MVSVYQVYQNLKSLANKEQKGFITPQVFNNFAAMAQMNIYNEMFRELVDAKKLSRQNLDTGRDKSPRKMALEDLSMYLRSEPQFAFVGVNGSFSNEASSIDKPSDLSRIISVEIADGTSPLSERRRCELVYNTEDILSIMGSNLSTPTDDFPVALVTNNTIEVIPETPSSVIITYYAKPTSFNSEGGVDPNPPLYAFSVLGGGNFFDFDNSRDFMLPSHCLSEVVMEMAKLMGVRLRDPQVTQFAAQEEASE